MGGAFRVKVPTSKGVVAIAMKTGAPIVPIYARREGFLRYTMVYSEPLPMERTGGSLDELNYRNARKINAFLEEVVSGAAGRVVPGAPPLRPGP